MSSSSPRSIGAVRPALLALSLVASFPEAQALAQSRAVAGGETIEFAGDARAEAIAGLIDPIVERHGRRIGVAVYDADLGAPLYLRNADRPLIPASNMKLYTTAAALDRLGPDYRYTTSLYARGDITAGGTLLGDLILVGRGDPTLSGRFHADSVTYVLDRFAEHLAAIGVRRVTGDLIGDATYFDDARVAPGWDESNLLWWYSARSGALSFNDNVVTLEVYPGESVGDEPEILPFPYTEGLAIDNRATTTSRRRRSIGVRRDPDLGGYRVQGRMPRRSGPVRYVVSVEDPAAFAISVFRERLKEAGIEVEGEDTVAHRWQEPPTVDARLVASHTSPPLIEIVRVINKRSQNFFAEQLLKTLGAVYESQGSLQAGARVVRSVLTDLGVDAGDLVLADGSGLSRDNRLTARQTAELLVAMRAHQRFGDFYDSLLIAGSDGNKRRLDAPSAIGNVRSKTGTLRGVSALSGYVTDTDGELLVFSILINNLPRGKGAAIAIEDAIVERLAEFSRWQLDASTAP